MEFFIIPNFHVTFENADVVLHLKPIRNSFWIWIWIESHLRRARVDARYACWYGTAFSQQHVSWNSGALPPSLQTLSLVSLCGGPALACSRVIVNKYELVANCEFSKRTGVCTSVAGAHIDLPLSPMSVWTPCCISMPRPSLNPFLTIPEGISHWVPL